MNGKIWGNWGQASKMSSLYLEVHRDQTPPDIE